MNRLNATEPLRLRCPKCSAAVRAAASLAGKRVKCPKCGGAIKVPGAAPNAADDDWLSLDDPLPHAASQAAPQSRPAHGPSGSGSSASASAGEPTTPPLPGPSRLSASAPRSVASPGPAAPAPAAEANADSDVADWLDDWSALDDLPASAATGPPAAGDANPRRVPPAPAPAPASSEYRAKCPICDAVHYVRPEETGKSIRCGDCYSEFVVPPPPKAVVKAKIDLERAATFRLSEVEGERDPFGAPGAKSAAEYLREAEDAETEDEVRSRYDDPDVAGWLRGIFGIFTDPSVIGYWLALALLGSIPGVLAVMTGHPLILLGTAVLSLLYSAFVLVCAFAILEAVAGGERRVEDWPIFSPVDWFGPCITTLVALALSALPGVVLAVGIFGNSMASVALILFSIYLMFPFVLLSMLDNGSVLLPASADVTRSVTRCTEAWGTTYFSAALLFFFYFLSLVMLIFAPPFVSVLLGCFFSIGFVFIYFSMIGRLAFSIGQAINAGPDDDEE